MDPFAVLGLDSSADLAAVQAARRRLATRWHPDVGGDPEMMARINAAAQHCERILSGRGGSAADSGPQPPSPSAGSHHEDRHADPHGDAAVVDHPSFRIEALPAEAHEALRIAGEWLGRILLDDPPYLLEVALEDPAPCWCQFHLLPEAGSSMVGLRVGAWEASPVPPALAVRDRVIEVLNTLDWATLGR